MLRMRAHVFAGFFAVTSYSCKVNALVFVVLLHVRNVNFLKIYLANSDAFTCIMTPRMRSTYNYLFLHNLRE